MFTVRIAGIPVGIDNRYDAIARRCAGFGADETPLFTVSASEEEMIREDGRACPGAEEKCVFRNMALRMMEYGAFVMHAAVADVDGQGVAFAAQSGTGKTTRLLLWRQAMGGRVRPVNGDKPILRFLEDGLYAFDTPWRGKEGLGGCPRTPLKHVIFIERAGEVSVRALGTEEIVPRLFRQLLVPREPERLERFMDLAERFVGAARFYLMKCDREREDPERIWERLKA